MTTEVSEIETSGLTMQDLAPSWSSVFADIEQKAFKYRFKGEILLREVLGGVPSDPHVIDGWLRTKLGVSKEEQIAKAVESTMATRGISEEEAQAHVAKTKSLNGFRRRQCADCPQGSEERCDRKNVHALYIEGRQLKAGLKEAASIAVAAGRLDKRGWGETNKGLLAYLSEHVMVVEEDLILLTPDGAHEVYAPSHVHQHFVNTRFGSAIQYQEVVKSPRIRFTIISDHPFTREEWGQIWVTGQLQGLGASRSQSWGRYTVVGWESVGAPVPTKKAGLVAPVSETATVRKRTTKAVAVTAPTN